MRSPDGDSEAHGSDGLAGAESGSDGDGISPLADGFAGDEDVDAGGDESAFGSGWSRDTDDNPFSEPFSEPAFGLQPDGVDHEGFGDHLDHVAFGGFGDTHGVDAVERGEAGGLSAFGFEPDHVPDTDLDLTGDGVVDDSDFHEASTAFSDFHVDPADSHGHAQNEGFFHAE
ncbi:MAG TPA: hypothetical protein VIL48_14545 [Acidimicrobiales bacterium]